MGSLQSYLWYESKEITPLALISNLVSSMGKEKLATKILSIPQNRLCQGAVCMDPLQPGDILTLRIKDQSAKNLSICNDAPERMVKQAIMLTMGLILKLTFRVLWL